MEDYFNKESIKPVRYWGETLKKAIVYTLAVFGAAALWVCWQVYGYFSSERNIYFETPEKMLLTINFDAVVPEVRADDLVGDLSGVPPISYFDLIKIIRRAAKDAKVTALAANVGMSSLGVAQIQGVRREIENFRKSGKKAYIYSDAFGSLGGGTGEYYLASAFDEITLMPNSEIGLTGIGVEVPFFKDVLQKAGIEPEFYVRYEYKNAAASLLQNKMSKEYRSELKKLGGALFETIVSDIASDRRLDKRKVRDLVDRAPLFSESALKEGLVDKLAFKTEFISGLEEKTGAKSFSASNYFILMQNQDVPEEERGKIAYMVISGAITGGVSNLNPWNGDISTGAETFLQNLKELDKIKNLTGLVVRIDSPGGSYQASNEIRNAILHFKEKHKLPVAVSMGNYAASGGYFAALAGDAVFAEPSSITGSIGVFGGKMVLAGLWKKLGVNWESVNQGKNAGILSMNHKFSRQEAMIFNQSLDNVYRDFVRTASKARKIPLKEMDVRARGRVFTGLQAKENGLIDEIGGIDAATDWVYERLNDKFKLKNSVFYYPAAKTFQQKLLELMGGTQKISVNKAVKEMGFDGDMFKMLDRLHYETILPPFKITY